MDWANVGRISTCRILKGREDRYDQMRLVYRGEHVDSKESSQTVEVPKEAGKWIGQKLGNYKTYRILKGRQKEGDMLHDVGLSWRTY